MTDQIEFAANNYNIPYWSDGFFDVDDDGDLVVLAKRNDFDSAHKLKDIIDELTHDDRPLPILLRFGNVIRERFDQIANAFKAAIEDNEYKSKYTCVYPIKVNQQRAVVNELAQHGKERFGLEAGSKPELLAVLGTEMPDNSIVVCNGYKDREYIRLALIGQKMGRRVFIVVEKMQELDLILEESAKMGIEPMLGVRVRMYAIGKGNWQDTGGEKSKFGLSPSQLLRLIKRLIDDNKAHYLKLLHCHLGSQISSIADIRKGIRECARYYVELRSMGVPLEVIDVGGGLGVDYEGTQSPSYYSINYSVREYANAVVQTISEAMESHGFEHPEIVTESGRALTAHHAVLVTSSFDKEQAPGILEPQPVTDADCNVLQNLWHHYLTVNEDNAREAFHSAVFYLNEALMLYTHESITLEDWARSEQLYFAICRKILPLLDKNFVGDEEIVTELENKLADKVFCNFSLFQSLPDAWGIEQIFPVVPLTHLKNPLTHRGIIKDITCDSDGRIERYVNGQSIEKSLLLPQMGEDEQMLMGIFMVGAYQEILGDLHNLFGDTHAVHLDLKEGGGFEEKEHTEGDTVADVLAIVHFEEDVLSQQYQKQLAAKNLSPEIQQSYLAELTTGLKGYTYLED